MADNKFCCYNPKQQVIYYLKNAITFIKEIFIRLCFVIALFHFLRFKKKTEKQFFGCIKYFNINTDETRIREIEERYSEVDVT